MKNFGKEESKNMMVELLWKAGFMKALITIKSQNIF
jgi:hypothetical protein